MRYLSMTFRVLIVLTTLAACTPRAAPTTASLPYTTPDWFKKAVLYEIFVPSFRDSDGDGLGDLRGITQSLDYIQSLGATAIWLTPIFPSPSYHGYDTTNYYAVRPGYGEKEDLVELVDQAHRRGMRIILDYVASHTSNQHPFFKDAYGNPSSKYSEFYIWKDAEHRAYQSYMNVEGMPTVNHGSETANQYFIDVAKYWMDLDGDGDYTDGIDGWRCDFAIGSPEFFWRQLRSALKPLNPDFLLLGEVWVREPSGQVGYFQDGFDAQFDYPLYFALSGDPAVLEDGLIAGDSIVSLATDKIATAQKLFDSQSISVRFIDNHDTDRAASEVSGDPQRLRLGALLLSALDGAPMIYYGEEIGMRGERGVGPLFYDEYRREPMDWYTACQGPGLATWFKDVRYSLPEDGVSVEEQDTDSQSLLNYYRAVFAMRNASPALSTGKYAALIFNPPTPNVWAFWRFTDDQTVAAFFNFSDAEVTLQVDWSKSPGQAGGQARNLLTGESVSVQDGSLSLPAASGLILELIQ